MALLDDLRAVAANLDPSLQPSGNEVGALLGALVAYTEHGDKALKAESPQDLSDLLTASAEEKAKGEPPAPSGGSSGGSSTASKAKA